MLVLSLPLFLATPSSPQSLTEAPLVVDLNQTASTEVGSSSPLYLGEHNGEAYFLATSDGVAFDVFRTDGTTSGTVNLQAGQDPAVRLTVAQALKLPTGQFLAAGFSEATGVELATFGAGTSGVQVLADIQPGPAVGNFGDGSSEPIGLTLWRDEAWFFADDGVHGYELWRSDGTPGGTRLAVDTNPGPAGLFSSQGKITIAGDRLFFNGRAPTQALYVLDDPDGTPLQLVSSTTSPPFGQHSAIEFGGGLFFTFDTAATGDELWYTDGTVQGTALFGDYWPGEGDSTPRFLASEPGRLWLNVDTPTVGRELWISDGTQAGTQMVADLFVGSFDGVTSSEGGLVPGGLLFVGRTGWPSIQVFFSDGTEAGTRILKNAAGSELSAGGSTFVEYKNRVYFTATAAGLGTELFKSDGTEAATKIVSNIGPGPESANTRPLGTVGDRLLIASAPPGTGLEPWITDGSNPGTVPLANLSPDPVSIGSAPSQLRRFRDKLVFRAQLPELGAELFVSDGTPEGTQLLADANPGATTSNPVPLTEIDAGLLFSVLPDGTGQELWITDGTPEGTRQVGVFDDGFAPQGWAAQRLEDGLAYFFAPDMQGNQVWRTDGTPEGTEPVPGYPIVPSFNVTNESRTVDGQWYFGGEHPTANEGFELWRTDGTPGGTVYVADLLPGPNSSAPFEFWPMGDVTLFTAQTATEGRQIWTTDGTASGTQQVTSLPSSDFIGPDFLTPFGDQFVFRFDDDVHGRELWITDGTQAGTRLLIDLIPGPASGNPFYMVDVGDELYFWASLPSGDAALYRTDGTEAGTVVIADEAGPNVPFQFGSALFPLGQNGVALFNVRTPEFGDELWITDGTQAGTRILSDIAPGVMDSGSGNLTRVGDQLFLRANDFLFGSELHTISLDDLGTSVAEPVGLGCGSSLLAEASANLGQTLFLETRSSSPLSLSALYLSVDLAFLSVGGDCQLHLGSPLIVSTFITDAEGSSTAPIAVPQNPTLAGLPIYFQSVSNATGGGLLGALELSNAVEVIAYP